MDVEGFILTGGASSRMGQDKSHMRLGGRSFVERAAEALSAVAGSIAVVSAREDAGASGLPVVRDIYEGAGALGGIHAALAATRARWAAIVSCDLPFVTGALFVRLAALRSRGAEQFETVVPVQTDGRRQPLCALYAREPCLEHAERLLRSGVRVPRALLALTRTRWVAPDEFADLEGADSFFLNVNTPEDYREACRREAERTGEVHVKG